jgi:MFS family permease
MMIDVGIYSALEFLSGFAPNLTVLLVLRALFGIAMGGEWGVGAALTMETVPIQSRGFVSGVLQAGYPTGYLLASIVYGLLYDSIGWRGMFNCVAGAVHSPQRPRIPFVDGGAEAPASVVESDPSARLEAGAVRDRTHDRVQLL